MAVIDYPTAISNLGLTASKTAYYRFTETSGTSIADSGGASHTATLTGTATLNQSTLLTNDSNPSVLMGGGLITSSGFMAAPTTYLALSCLVSFNSVSTSGNGLVVAGTNNATGVFQLAASPGSNTFQYSFRSTVGTSVGFSSPALTQGATGRVYHVLVMHDFANKTVKMYQDGLLVSTGTYTETVLASSSQPVRVGSSNVNAYIDEALVTADKLLTDDDVYNLFRAARGVDASATTIYVGPSGNYRATGTSIDPIDFYTAIRSGYAKPGQSYNLKAGDYLPGLTTGFPVLVHGTALAHLTIQNNPGEHVRILQPHDDISLANYAIQVTSLAQYVDLKGNWDVSGGGLIRTFEVTNTGTARTSPNPATNVPTGEENGRSTYSLIFLDTEHVRTIGLIIHDGNVGMDISQASNDSEWHDNVGYNNGCDNGGVNATGMTFYTQNVSGTQRFVNTVSFRNFNMNFQGYGKTGNLIGVHIEGGSYYEAGAPIAALRSDPHYRGGNIFIGTQTTPQDDTLVTNTDTYMAPLGRGSNIALGYIYLSDLDATITNNRVFGGPVGIFLRSHASGTVTGNWIYTRKSDVNVHYNGLTPATGHNYSTFTWDNNTYIVDPSNGGTDYVYNGTDYTYDVWKAMTGFDANSALTTAVYTGTTVTPHVSEVTTGFGSLAIANFGLAASVNVNLSTFGLVNGQTVTIVDADRVLESDAVVKSLTYNSGAANTSTAVPVDILDTQPTQPYGVTGVTRNREFRAYIVIPGAQSNPNVPDAPTGLSANLGTSVQVVLSYTVPASGQAATGVTVERSLDGVSYSVVTTSAPFAAGAQTYTDTSVAAKQFYYYRISSQNGAGSSLNVGPTTSYTPVVNCLGSHPCTR